MNALVIVDVEAKQVNKPFTYIVPKEFESIVEKGQRVLVPFGVRTILGFIIDFNYDAIDNLKEIIDVLDIVPAINSEMLELSYKIANETSSFLISVLKTMIPNALTIKYEKTLRKINDIKSKEINDLFISDEIEYKKIDKKLLNLLKYEIKEKNIEVIYNTIKKESIKEESYVKLLKYAFLKNDKQQEILDYLLNKDNVKKSDLKDFSLSSLKTLEKNGFISIYKEEVYREIKNEIESKDKYIELNPEQKHAYESVDLDNNLVYLLYGVTGSGKTEVYLKLIEDTLERGKSAIFLVPEISLTPQMASRVKAKFKDCAVFHSAMSDNERYDEWRKIYRNDARVIVGARSAIFAPIKNIGLIIIDEEHEHTYKQDSTNPRYHARDVALLRSKYHNCPLILGSATPSIESFFKAKTGEYKLLTLPHRANNSILPNMHIINMSEELSFGNKSMLSNTLKNLISDRLSKNEQVMLLINKRGYSSFYLCRDCGKSIECPNCDITLTYHKNSDKLLCHYCGYTINNPKRLCPSCGSTRIKDVGIGSEQVEELIKNEFCCNVLRMDSDTTKNKGSHAQIIKDFMDEKASVLVGTQMISKGLDFENVTLVGILMADLTLKMPDYRSSERTYDLITQVAGRAGRREKMGDVVVQSYNTDHYSINQTKYNNYESFYSLEIKNREMANLPPFSYLSQLVISDKDMTNAFKNAKMIKSEIEDLMPCAKIIGPATANIARVNNMFRVQITIKNKNPNTLLFKILEKHQDLDIYVDHDPILI